MPHKIAGWMLLLSSLLQSAFASDVILKGKIESQVTAFINNPDNLFVTDTAGGWFDQGLTMEQSGGWNSPYEVQARLRIVSSSGVFQVRLDEPVQLRHLKNPAKVFQKSAVTLAALSAEAKNLVVGQNVEFKNPPPAIEGEDSVGYYDLDISAYPPEGSFKDNVGTYSGEVSLTFEPIAIEP
ncbi:hypothetical protein [Pseudomonas hunanensis]|uniref:hypothetical protein n=1 Tax=Pseudomonas hunanensis TaxID=1247546 RepID=UPI00240593A8|nr:hypothetical protein [Pseudomonas hunanensis]MDF9755636.1 hypothetical protein [Pseudomonas hunanensis]